jgi:phage-related protein
MSKLAAMATRAWTAAQWLFNAALTANPIGLIIIGIAGLIAAGVLLYKNWDLVGSKAQDLWVGIKNAFKAGANAVIPMINHIIDALNKLPGVSIKKIELYEMERKVDVGTLRAIERNGAMQKFASGGFASRPSIFGEDGLEVAIPMDGSPRSLSLWEKAGRMLGALPPGSGGINITYAPVIHAPGGDPGVIRQVLQKDKEDFKEKIKAFIHQEERLSYA